MGKGGRPSLKKTDYSGLNYYKISAFEKKKLLLDLLNKAPRGLTIKEINKKFISYKTKIQKYLNELINDDKVIGPYCDIYFHKRYVVKKNGR